MRISHRRGYPPFAPAAPPRRRGRPPAPLCEQFGGGAGIASDIDVVNVPADLTDPPTILSSGASTSSVAPGAEDDDAATATSDESPESPAGDPDNNDGGPVAATDLASPQIVTLSNGLYASEFEPDPV